MKRVFDILNKTIVFIFFGALIGSGYYFLFRTSYHKYVVRFEESINGLTAGAEVYVGGVANGHVHSVAPDKSNFDRSTVVLNLDVPIDPKHAIAQITNNGFTNLKSISVFYSDDEHNLPDIDNINQIKVQKNPLNIISRIFREGSDVNTNIQNIALNLQKSSELVKDMLASVKKMTFDNLDEEESVYLGDKVMTTARNLAEAVDNFAKASRIILNTVKKLEKNNYKKAKKAIDDLASFIESLNEVGQGIRKSKLFKYFI